MHSQLHRPPHLLGVEPGRGVEPPATQAASARSSALIRTRCSSPLHSLTRTRSGSSSYRPTTSPPEPSAMPSVSQVKRILSPCLKVQSSDRVGALLLVIRIFIGSEDCDFVPQVREHLSLGERTLSPLPASAPRRDRSRTRRGQEGRRLDRVAPPAFRALGTNRLPFEPVEILDRRRRNPLPVGPTVDGLIHEQRLVF